MSRTITGLLCAGLLGLLTARLSAQEQPSPYTITPKAGEWLIIVTCYKGENAATLAHGLAEQIRRDYQLPAYIFNRGAEEKAKEDERVRRIIQQQREFLEKNGLNVEGKLRVKRMRIEEEYAVLVGGYKSMEDARKSLDRIRKLQPPAEKFMNSVSRVEATEGDQPDIRREYVNPFLTGFVVHNPSIPRQQDPNAGKPDPFIKELNSEESFSLLKNSKNWTLVVKNYHGSVIVQPQNASGDFWKKLGLGKQSELLTASAMQAHSMAELLRKMGYDAYVLHLRHSSLVTVGGFDAPDDPKLLTMQRSLGQLKLNGLLDTDRLYSQPMPMEVPRY